MGVHDGHRGRLKERFLKEGLTNFEDHNVLELLLFYSIPRSDTNVIAHNLINTFGTLHGVFDASVEALCKVDGISTHSALLIKLIPEMFSRYHVDKTKDLKILNSTTALGNYFVPKFYGKTTEELHIALLDTKKKLLSYEKISDGTANTALVDIKKIMALVVNSTATAVAIAHNHPGGIAIPSSADIISTKKLYNALKIVNVELVDHIIVADGDYVSMADSGIFIDFRY